MAELRRLVYSLGHADVMTYIQSGNLLFTPRRSDTGTAALAAELQAAITDQFGLNSRVIVLSRAELADVISSNPYADEPNPKFVHGVFMPAELDDAAAQRVREAVAVARDAGSRDEATVAGRTLYLHTPDGFGTSELAKTLLTKRASPGATGTARNWNTVTKLLGLCDRG
jgi:uncharacterized protein (DUF1697 family)